MHNLRIGLLALAAVCILFNLVGCKTLALSGEKKYKVDLSNVVLNIKDEIEKTGDVSDDKLVKFEKLMDKYRDQFGDKGSFQFATQALAELKEAKANPDDAFKMLNVAVGDCGQVLEMLKTEIQD